MKPCCPECGSSLSDGLADGLCPACLLDGLELQGDISGDFAAPGSSSPLLSLPGYEIVAELARGGMGIVYQARQRAPNREVALKMLLPYSASSQELRERFHLEARTLSDLDHPAILPIYETGEFDGLPWFSMKLATGGSLAQRQQDFRGRWEMIAGLMVTLADAVQFAHDRGVLHRDLKPANILFDSANRPFVADFGLAKLVRTDGDVTRSLNILGTPQYLAPEVATGSVRHATTGSDVYSLGAILFELLSGRRPFEADGFPALLKKIAEEDPVFPLRDGEGNETIPRDLQVIALKCLTKNPAERYGSARELGDELRRYLAGEPIHARPMGVAGRFWSWCRRNRALAYALVACVFIASAGLAGILWELHQTEAARRLAAHRADAEQAQRVLADKARGKAEESERIMRENLYAADMFDAQRALAQDDLGTARLRLEGHRPKPGQIDVRGFEWRYLWGRTRGDSFAVLKHTNSEVTALAFSRDGSRLAFGSRLLFLHDVASLKLIAKARSPNIQSAAFVPGSDDLVLGLRSPSEVWRWSAAQPEKTLIFFNPHGRWPNVCVSPRGDVMAVGMGAAISGNPEGSAAIYNVADGSLRKALPEAGGMVGFSPDGNLLATGSWKDKIKLWNPQNGALVRELVDVGHVVSLRFSPDSKWLVECSFENGVWLYNVESGNRRPAIQTRSPVVWDAEISPDGRTLASCGADQAVRLWDIESGLQKACLLGHSYVVAHVAWSPDGKFIASGGQDGSVRLWRVEQAREKGEFLRGVVRKCFFSDKEDKFAAFDDGSVTIHDSMNLSVTAGPRRIGFPLGFMPDGKVLLTIQRVNGRPEIQRWSTQNLEFVGKTTVDNGATSLVLPTASPDGQWLAAGSGKGEISVWNLSKPGTPLRLTVKTNRIGQALAVAFSPNSRLLAASFFDSTLIQIWNLADGTGIQLGSHRGFISQLCFSSDGRTLVSADSDKFIKVWDVVNRKELATLLGHRSGIIGLDISPDGRTIVSSSSDKTVRLWNLATKREVARFEMQALISSVAFEPGGNALFVTQKETESSKASTLIWRAPALAATDTSQKAQPEK